MSEKNAFKILKENTSRGHLRRRLDRLENLVGIGWPDVNGCFHGIEFWIEIKAPTEPKRESTPLFGSNHKLTQEQKNWIKNQMIVGGLAYIYIDTGKTRILIGGSKADSLNEMTVNELINESLWSASVPMRDKKQWEGIADAIANRKV